MPASQAHQTGQLQPGSSTRPAWRRQPVATRPPCHAELLARADRLGRHAFGSCAPGSGSSSSSSSSISSNTTRQLLRCRSAKAIDAASSAGSAQASTSGTGAGSGSSSLLASERTTGNGAAGSVSVLRDAGSTGFLEWAQRAGIRAPKLQLATFDGLRGVLAAQDIAAGEVFAAVPRDAALLVKPKARCPFPDFVAPAFWASCPWYTKMALQLLHERGRGDASRLAPYIRQLPRRHSTPLHWAPEQQAALRYPFILEAVQYQREAWDKLHAELVAATPGCTISRDDLVWAMECVRSRTFSGPYAGASWKERGRAGAALAVVALAYTQWAHIPWVQAANGVVAAALFNVLYDFLLSRQLRWYAMCPLVDAHNHAAGGDEVLYEYFQDAFVLAAGKPFAKGQQVTISYGDHSNDQLLQFYGFVEAGSPHDDYVLTDFLAQLEAAGVAQAAGETRPAVLEAVEKVTITRAGFDRAVVQVVRRLVMPPEPAASALGAPPSLSAPERGIELQAHQVLRRLVDRLLDSLGPAEADSDERRRQQPARAASRAQAAEAAELAHQFRAAKRDVLAGAAAQLDAKVAQLAAAQAARG